MTRVVGVRFRKVGRVYDFDPNGLDLRQGVPVIVDTQKGLEYGLCAGAPRDVEDERIVPPLRKVERLATEGDAAIVRSHEEKERQAVDIFRKRAEAHNLVMKLVEVEYAFDGARIIFFFTADGRVDFRDLVKDLASVFRTRIELRQVGVRDEAKMTGGLGICGRAFCCSEFLSEFQPVSIKMAKEQNLSLNPAKISGTCGRLMCCLKYEQEAYEDLLATTPRVDSVVQTPMGVGVVTDVSLLRGNLRVRLDDAPETPQVFHKSELGEGRRKPKPVSGQGAQDGAEPSPPGHERSPRRQASRPQPPRPQPTRAQPAREGPAREGPAREGAVQEKGAQHPPFQAGKPPLKPGGTAKPFEPKRSEEPQQPRRPFKPRPPKGRGNREERP